MVSCYEEQFLENDSLLGNELTDFSNKYKHRPLEHFLHEKLGQMEKFFKNPRKVAVVIRHPFSIFLIFCPNLFAISDTTSFPLK